MIRTIAVALALAVAACAHDGTNAPATAVPLASAAKVLQSAHAPKAIGPYSQAVQTPAGRFLFLSGQIPLDPATGKIVEGDIVAQTDRVMQNLQFVLGAAGASLDDVVKTTIFLVDLGDFAKVNETYARYFKQAPPARATVQVAALPRGSRVEIECVAVKPAGVIQASASGQIKVVESAQAPKAIGPYSQAVEATGRRPVFLSGQIPLDPATGQMVPGDVVAQTERVMQNLGAVLEASGATFSDVVKTTIFLVDLGDFAKVNETYARYFKQAPPARATVQVAALPRGSLVEIESVAMPGLGLAGLGGVKPIQSAQAPKAIGPYSQAMNAPAGQFIYLSGQIPIDPVSGQMVEGDIVAQTDRVMKNLAAVLDAGGASFDNVVKTTIFLVDLADFGKVNETYGRYFKTAPPARATVQVRALPRGSRVEIEAIAAM